MISLTIKILNIYKTSFFPANKRCYHCVEPDLSDPSFVVSKFPNCTPVEYKHSQQKWNEIVDCSGTDRFCSTEVITPDPSITDTKNCCT